MSVVDDNSIHKFSLNSSHWTSGTGNPDKLQQLMNAADEFKKSMIANLIKNVKYQSQGSTILEFESAFDFNGRIDLKKSLDYIDHLIGMHCIDFAHNVVEDADFWSD